MIKRALFYPLFPATLTAGLLFYAVLGLLFAAYRFTYAKETSLGNIWLASSFVAVLAYSALLLDYGMQILRDSAGGKQTPPVVSGSLTSIEEGSRRCVRLALLLGPFVAIARQLHSLGWMEAEWAVWILLFLLMPALFANNVLYDSVLTMLNPAAVWTTTWNLGWVLAPALMLLALVGTLTWTGLTGSTGTFLLLFPMVLYCHFLFFHIIGLRVYARTAKFFAQVNFKADREQTQNVSENLAGLNRELSEAHEWMRAGQHTRVLEKLDELLRRSSWRDFERLFAYTSDWFDKAPAVYLCRLHLDNQGSLRKPMRAFELAQWALKREDTLTLTRVEALPALAAHAVTATATQYRTVLQLIENYLQSNPDSPQQNELRQLALALAGEKIKDEALYARLKASGLPQVD